MERESPLQNILVATKFCIPSLPPRLISRHHLMNSLNQGLGLRLTLISAPAGFGKTTLLAKWVDLKQWTTTPGSKKSTSDMLPLKVAWVSLDKSDDNLQIFWRYVFTALEYSHRGLGTPLLNQLQSESGQPVEAVLASLINRLIKIDRHFALALDDYHHITDPDIHSSLTYLLDHLPPQLHIFMVTRNNPS